MHDSSDPEVELYEVIVRDLKLSPPVKPQSLSAPPSASVLSVGTVFHDHTKISSRRQAVEATDLFADAP